MRTTKWIGIALALLCASCSDSGSRLESAEALLGAAGGVIELPNGTKIDVPAGALSSEVLIRLAELDPRDIAPAPSGLVHGKVPVAFTPHGTVFVQDIKITLPHSGSTDRKVVVRLVDEGDGIWKIVPRATEDPGGMTIYARKFSVYSVFEGPQPLIPGISFEGATPTQAIVVGDIDDDGDADVITGHDGPNALFINDGTGTVEGPLTGPGAGNTTAMTGADPYGYGYVTLLVLGQSGAADEVWWNDDPTMPGTFNFYTEYLTAWDGSSFDSTSLAYALDAFNYDSILATTTSGTSYLLANVDGWIDISPQTTPFPVGANAAVFAELTGNAGFPDILFGTPSASVNPLWQNDTMGGFLTSSTSVGDSSVTALAVGDLDGDGDLDVYVGTDGNAPDEVWLYDSGLGTYASSGQALGLHNTLAVALGDLDGDGDLDAFAGTDGTDFVYWNDGSGTFTVGPLGYGEAKAVDVVMADMDGDLDLDVVVANADAPNQIWLQD